MRKKMFDKIFNILAKISLYKIEEKIVNKKKK